MCVSNEEWETGSEETGNEETGQKTIIHAQHLKLEDWYLNPTIDNCQQMTTACKVNKNIERSYKQNVTQALRSRSSSRKEQLNQILILIHSWILLLNHWLCKSIHWTGLDSLDSQLQFFNSVYMESCTKTDKNVPIMFPSSFVLYTTNSL